MKTLRFLAILMLMEIHTSEVQNKEEAPIQEWFNLNIELKMLENPLKTEEELHQEVD